MKLLNKIVKPFFDLDELVRMVKEKYPITKTKNDLIHDLKGELNSLQDGFNRQIEELKETHSKEILDFKSEIKWKISELEKVKKEYGIPVLTDVHEDTPLAEVASVVDVLQTPAFLCRQTNFILKVAEQGLPVNIKKGQFLAPWDMTHVAEKAKSTGNQQIMLCDRGTSFGYNTLVSDMRGLPVMRAMDCPVVFDATHSVQQPGGQGGTSGGQREFVPVLARAAVAVGVAGVFMETHPEPEKALSDGANSWPLARMEALLTTLMAIDSTVKQQAFIEDDLI